MKEYRVVKQGPVYSIHEVELDNSGEITNMNPDAIAPAAHSVQDLATVLIYMNRAFTEPVIEVDVTTPFQQAQDILNGRKN